MPTEIQKIKIALTSDCTLRCSHCKIDKKSNLNISFEQAKKAVEFLVESPGEFKRLELYGGEPFLKFELLKKIVSYAKKSAKVNGKRLSLSIATNATVLNAEMISWIKKSKVNISVSFSGSFESHNHNRVYSPKVGSYDKVSFGADSLLKKIGSDFLVCLYCVDGFFAKNMVSDFDLIVEKGFKAVNIECVSGSGWSKKDYFNFEKGFSDILSRIALNIETGYFVYLEPFIEMIADRKSWDYSCPKYRDLEMYPDGNMGFYPYAFVDYVSVREKISVGNYKHGLNSRYSLCFPGCEECFDCSQKYYTLPGLSDGSLAYEVRSKKIRKFFFDLLKKRKNTTVRNYLLELNRIRGLTYV